MTTTTCTHGPSAVTGERCGAPAVTTFTAPDGTVYAECADHAATATIEDDTVTVHRYGRDYVGTIVKRGERGAVYAEITYDNGVKRTVRVEG